MPYIRCSSPPRNWPLGPRRLTQLAAQFLSSKTIEPTEINLTEFWVKFECERLSAQQLSVLIDDRWPVYRDYWCARENNS